MKKLLLVISCCFACVLNAQQLGSIEGKVLEYNGNDEPITFATVSIKETETSITTDFRGNYFFKDLESGTYTLEFQFLGYNTITKKITIAGNEKLKTDVFLEKHELPNFDEATIIGALN